MNLRFDQPLWLLVAALVIPMAVIALRWFGTMAPTRRWSAIVIRLALLALLAAILAGASSVRRTNKVAVIAVIDASGSIRRYASTNADSPASTRDALTRVKAFLSASTNTRGPEDLLGAVIFDGRSTAVATPTAGDVLGRDFDLRQADGTDIASALRLARAMIPADATGRLLLFSDGNQTVGDALAAAGEASGGTGSLFQAASSRIDVVPIRYALDREVMVESVDAPTVASAEAVVPLRVTLSATAPTTGTLRVFRDGRELAISPPGSDRLGRRLTLAAGLHVERAEIKLDKGRIHRFRAQFEPDVASDSGTQVLSGDTVTENNHGEAFTITPGAGSVLLVDGVSNAIASGPGAVLANTLREAGIDTLVVPPSAIPEDVLSLQAYDLIIFENVPAETVQPRVQEQIVAYVRDLGGGFVMIGGPDSFGAGAWIGSAIEPILPVKLNLPDQLVTPEAATVFVLDNSGSMYRFVLGSARTQQEIANDAAALAIKTLDKGDLVGVIAFNTDTETIVPLDRNVDAIKTGERVRRISAGGGTNVVPALDLAARWLANVNAKIKHVVVLSDGITRDPSGRSPVKRAGELRAMGIQVSCIAVGDGADLQQMSGMAQAGDGVFFHAVNADTLPQLFMKAVRVVRTPLIREETFDPVLLPGASTIIAGLGTPPPLNGLVLTQPRPEPTIINAIATPKGEPVLSHWNVGLGQVVAFTSDAHNWAKPWLGWPGYARLWTQIVRVASRPPMGRMFQVASEIAADGLKLRMSAIADDGAPVNELTVSATVFSPSGESQQVRLTQTGPGTYEGAGPVREAGSYVAVIKPTAANKAYPPVVVGGTLLEGEEYRRLTSNDTLLRQIAERTGGQVLDLANPQDAKLYARAGLIPREAFTSLWRPLLIAAIIAFLLDVATRRVAWDRWVSRRFGVNLHQAAAEATAARDVRGAIAGLKARAEAVDEKVAAVDAIALSDRDAQRLALAARDRRRAQRIATSSPVPSPSSTNTATATSIKPSEPALQPAAPIETADQPETTPSTAPNEGGLLAAKRRAAKKYEDR